MFALAALVAARPAFADGAPPGRTRSRLRTPAARRGCTAGPPPAGPRRQRPRRPCAAGPARPPRPAARRRRCRRAAPRRPPSRHAPRGHRVRPGDPDRADRHHRQHRDADRDHPARAADRARRRPARRAISGCATRGSRCSRSASSATSRSSMHKGSQRGQVIVEVHVVERGTLVLNRLWFGTTTLSPWWVGADVGERNLLGLGIAVGGGFIYAGARRPRPARAISTPASCASRDTVAARHARGASSGALTLVHGSEPYRVAGRRRCTATRRLPARSRTAGSACALGATYDVSRADPALDSACASRRSTPTLPVAPTQTLPDGRVDRRRSPPRPGHEPRRHRELRLRSRHPPRSGAAARRRHVAAVGRARLARCSAAATTSRRSSAATSTTGRCTASTTRSRSSSPAASWSATRRASIGSTSPTSITC